MTESPIARELAALADPAYQRFQSKLIPTIDPARVLGVRAPALRRYAREMARTREDEARAFMARLPHVLYEEDNLHGELIGLLAKTPDEAFELLDAFLPHVDNWATCDLIRVPAFKKDLPAVLERIRGWMAAEPEYMVRFGVVGVVTQSVAMKNAPSMRPPEKTGTDLERLEILNAAAREICQAPPPVDRLPLVLRRPAARWSWRELAGYVLGSGAFAVFFGGSLLDGVASGTIGGIVYVMEQVRRVHRQNKVIYTAVACFLAGLLAQLCLWLGFGNNLDRVMIGDIMLFIPGLVIVNGVREFFYADILTGVYRLIEALLIAGAIALGYAVALMLGGRLL